MWIHVPVRVNALADSGYNVINTTECRSGARTPSGVATRRRRSSSVTSVSPQQVINNGRRSDDRAFAMYERYCDGLSLAQVAQEFGVSRQSVYKILARRGLPLRSKPQSDVIEYRGRRFTKRPTGYIHETGGERVALHRVMWEEVYGPIPDGFEIQHVDGDKTHNEVANFVCLSKADHALLHGKLRRCE